MRLLRRAASIIFSSEWAARVSLPIFANLTGRCIRPLRGIWRTLSMGLRAVRLAHYHKEASSSSIAKKAREVLLREVKDSFRIAHHIAQDVVQGIKIEAAVASASARFNLGRSTIFALWNLIKNIALRRARP